MVTLGDIIIIGTIFFGAIPVAKLLWKSYGKGRVSTLFPKPAPEITSTPRLSAPSSPSVSQTDTPIVIAPAAPAEPTRDEILDACKVLRAKGLSREEARAVFKALHRKLDNNLWTAAAPAQEDADLTVNPWSGRQTKRSFYPGEPDLEYKELEV